MRKSWIFGALCGVLAFVPVADAGSTGKTITLKPGQSVSIGGTKIVCQYGGPAGETAIWCGVTGASPGFIPHTKGFALNLNGLKAFEVKTLAPKTRPTKVVTPGVTYSDRMGARQPNLPAALSFKSVGSVKPGDFVLLDQMKDLTCFPYIAKGERKVRVGCAPVDDKNQFRIASYGASVSDRDVELVQFDSNHFGKSLFYRKQPCLPVATNYGVFAKRTNGSITRLQRLGLGSKAKELKSAVRLVQIDDYSGAAGVLKKINVSGARLPQKKSEALRKQVAALVGRLAPKCA